MFRRWVLIRPLNRSLYYDPEIQEPLGIEYLGAVLKKNGCSVLLLDSALDDLSDDKLARRTVAFEPDVVGFSITTDRELDSVINIYRTCIRLKGEAKYTWLAGGNFVTSETNHALHFLPEEFTLVKFESETSITRFIEEQEKGCGTKPERLIPGQAVAELDQLPFPLRPYAAYLVNYGWAFNLQGSRGCCSTCHYCASRGMRTLNRPGWRGRSPRSMVDEMEALYEQYNARTFNFVDEDFLGPPSRAPERALSFSDEIKRRNLELTYGIQVRPDSLSRNVIESLVSSGLKYVFMGIESDDPDDFRRWGRAYCPDAWEWVRLLQANDVEVNAGTLLFHPDCTPEGILNFASKLREHGLFNYRTAINRLDAMPGSLFHEQYNLQKPEEERYPGIFSLPFHYRGMETFYETLLKVLAPVEVPSMHALCALPVAQTLRIFGNNSVMYSELKKINNLCDDIVTQSFFALLEMFNR